MLAHSNDEQKWQLFKAICIQILNFVHMTHPKFYPSLSLIYKKALPYTMAVLGNFCPKTGALISTRLAASLFRF